MTDGKISGDRKESQVLTCSSFQYVAEDSIDQELLCIVSHRPLHDPIIHR
jgi:hypothetical protein